GQQGRRGRRHRGRDGRPSPATREAGLSMLRLVLPKGSLEQATMQLFEDADLAVSRSSGVDRRPVIDTRAPAHGQVGVLEELHRRLLERALGEHQPQHGQACFPSCRRRSTISTAVAAASAPLLPSGPPARARAWSTSSVVSTPKAIGTPVSRATRLMPDAHSPATKSKCGVSPRMTAPRQITASSSPDSTSCFATSGISNAPGTQTTGTDSGSSPWPASSSSAPSSSNLVMSSLNRPATIARRIPVASGLPSYSVYLPMWLRG